MRPHAQPASWSNMPPFRACAICVHGRNAEGGKREIDQSADLCACPEVAGRKTVPIHLARSNGGACGPEAHHLSFPGLLP